MADTIKCPNCSANLLFDADLQKLTCDYCGATFLPTDEAIVNQTHTFTEDVGTNETKVIEDLGVSESEATKRGMADEPEIEYDESSMHELTCNSCGAIVVADVNTTASYCAFCGSPAIVEQRLTSEFRPKYIIPFKYGKEEATKKFFNWCKGGRFTPFGFVSPKNIEKLTGLYVPFWLFDVEGNMHVEANAQMIDSVTVGSKTTTTTTYFEISRKGKYKWRRIPLDGASRIDDELMEAIEPFNYKQMLSYNPAYLPGFFADKYDLNPTDLDSRIKARAKDYLEEEFKESTKQYQKVNTKFKSMKVGESSSVYALLPVWFMHYKYLGKSYDFAMNGQTGEVAGKAPISVVKRIVLYFMVLAILAVIMRVIIGLILGGIYG